MLSRRQFLNFSAATIALTSLPNQIQSNQLIRNYKLTAEITPHSFDKKGVLDSLWLYNKQTPGPVIEAKENDIIRVEFVNNLDEASTIHWHGIKNINKIKRIDKETYSKGESTLLFQKAKELRSDGKTLDALKMSRQALKKYAGLVPNSIFLSELEVLEGQKKKAETVLLSTWKVIPHPDVAKKFAEIEANESVDDRVERFKKILNVKKSDVETKTLKAELNILSENFPEARRAISDLIETDQANAKVYTLMAAIEKGVGSSDAVVKGWLAKAVTAKRSKRWICSNCESQSEWEPVCKKCGEFSTLEWREERYENLGENDQSEILPLIIGENNYSTDIQVDKVEIDVNKV